MKQLNYKLPVILCVVGIIILLVMPTGYEKAGNYKGSLHCKARVTKVYNDRIISTGLIKSGEQTCTVTFLNGKFKGKSFDGFNLLNGSLESDKIFQVGDTALVLVNYEKDEILSVNLIDHYRMNYEFILALLFVALLIIFAGKTGFRAIFSFVFTILCIWKILCPALLKGYHPIYIGLLITVILTVLIIALVYGFNMRCLSAVSGAILGVVVTALLGIIFTTQFKIHGAIMTSSESLLYSGFQDLNLTQVFMASIFIGSSGAIMDLAVDITSAVYEVVQKKPDISAKEAIRSGINVGRCAMGTMTTTLLLAYSGGYIALLMVLLAQGTPIYNILNYKYVSAEIIDTIVGSFGLVTVAPFTAITSGFLLTKKRKAV